MKEPVIGSAHSLNNLSWMMRSRVIVVCVGLLLTASACADAKPEDVSSERTTTSTGVSPSTTSSSTSTTASEDEDPGDLLVVGDWGSGTVSQGAVAGAMQRYAAEHDVTAILTTGDNFYEDDLEFLMTPFGWATEAGIPFWITWGNHDVESEARIAALNQAFGDPPRWGVHEWGALDVIVLDSTQITSPQQTQFFLDAMGDSSRPTIVTTHHPPYSCARHGSSADVVRQVVDVLDDDAFFVLSGHDHLYQRFEQDGVDYVVTGGGGAQTYRPSRCRREHPQPLAAEAIHHFLALQQTATGVQVTAIDVNGDTIDIFEVPLP